MLTTIYSTLSQKIILAQSAYFVINSLINLNQYKKFNVNKLAKKKRIHWQKNKIKKKKFN